MPFCSQENMMLKEQIEGLTRENTILKSAFKIQHERQIEYENKSQELQQMKQLMAQYQEQLRTLEVRTSFISLLILPVEMFYQESLKLEIILKFPCSRLLPLSCFFFSSIIHMII